MSGSRDLGVGTLCVIAPRGRTVFGYQFYGSYPNEKGGYDAKKTTGDMIDAIESGAFITSRQHLCLDVMNAPRSMASIMSPVVFLVSYPPFSLGYDP